MKQRKIQGAATFTAALLLFGLVGCGQPAPAQPAGEEVKAEFATYEEYGKVIKVVPQEGKVYIEAEGYYGYHMEENPSVTMGTTILQDGTLESVAYLSSVKQTEGFAEQITEDYLAGTYKGVAASPKMEVAAVSGATITSKAALYAVQTAAYYAEQVYGYVSNTNSADLAEIESFLPGTYTAIQSSYEPDAKLIGNVLFAAEGKTEVGADTVIMKVRGSSRISFKGSANTGWDSAEPGRYTMLIAVDKATSQVTAWSILTDGTTSDYFTVPAERIDSYKTVSISAESAFDTFTEGLVTELDVEIEAGEDNNTVITGTSILYTGATESGTFSSQAVRQCFRTAAYFYCNYSA